MNFKYLLAAYLLILSANATAKYVKLEEVSLGCTSKASIFLPNDHLLVGCETSGVMKTFAYNSATNSF